MKTLIAILGFFAVCVAAIWLASLTGCQSVPVTQTETREVVKSQPSRSVVAIYEVEGETVVLLITEDGAEITNIENPSEGLLAWWRCVNRWLAVCDHWHPCPDDCDGWRDCAANVALGCTTGTLLFWMWSPD